MDDLAKEIKSNQEVANIVASVLGKVSHDMLSPIRVMQMVLDGIAPLIPLDDLTLMEGALQSLHHMARDLLEQYRNATDVKKIHTLLTPLLEDLVKQKEKEWQPNPCQIIFTMDEAVLGVPWACLLPDDLRRVLSNLLNNAYEALGDTRRIIELHLATSKTHHQLIIKDNGRGIPAQQIAEALHGTSSKHAGSGVGLSSAVSYFKSLGGGLYLSSKVGRGTKITIQIPRVAKPAWFADSLLLDSNRKAIIFDVKGSCRESWQSILNEYEVKYDEFSTIDNLILAYDNLPDSTTDWVAVTSHKLHKRSITNIAELVEENNYKDVYVITTQTEELWLQEEAARLGFHLIPSVLADDITLLSSTFDPRNIDAMFYCCI